MEGKGKPKEALMAMARMGTAMALPIMWMLVLVGMMVLAKISLPVFFSAASRAKGMAAREVLEPKATKAAGREFLMEVMVLLKLKPQTMKKSKMR